MGILAAAFLAPACGGRQQVASSALVVPVSFEAHLLTARQCEFRGLVTGGQDVSPDANVLLAFAYSVEGRSHKSSSSSGATTIVTTTNSQWSTERAQALKCPPAVLQALTANRVEALQ